MTPERWRRVLELFQAALELPESERDAFVRGRAATDVELAEEVLRMLRVGTLDPDFLQPATRLEGPPRQLGDFELLEELGRGGMGIVYRARQVSLDREVAVKVLPPSLVLGERQVDRFRREARAIGRLHHPGIVQILMVGREGDTNYFAMELVSGRDLGLELKRLRAERGHADTQGSRLPSSHSADYLRTVARLMVEAADALHHAHEHGVVHRDVKPSNLLLDANGVLKVVDFGLARDASLESLSRSGDFVGTPYYMSPEQVRARRHLVDHRTDVYSLGVVLYELLTLQRPFEGRSSQEIMDKIIAREAERVRKLNPRVSRDMATICETAMSKDLARRYSNAAALRDDLKRFLDHAAIQARPIGPVTRLAQAGRHHRWRLAAAAVVLAALFIGSQWRIWRQRQALLGNSEQAIEGLLREGPLSELLPDQLIALREHLRIVTEDTGLGRRFEGLREELDSLRIDLRERGLTAMQRARDRTQPEGVREQSQLEGLQILMHAALVFPEDAELQRLAAVENTYPRLSVRVPGEGAGRPPARVYLREIDPWTSGVGERRELGPAPIEGRPVLPGYYRVVVVFDDARFREVFVQAGPATMDVVLDVRPGPAEAEATEGMVRLDAVRYTFANFDSEPSYQGRSVDIAAFWLDATEVSNADYARFLGATGHPEPIFWMRGGGLDGVVARYPELPVIGVSWNDAQAYASWAGKRLPTSAEWHYAAGGLENRAWPWSADPQSELRGNVHVPIEAVFSDESTWTAYITHARAVDSSPEASTPEGIFNIYGNVDEWSESPAISLMERATPMLHPFGRFVWGGHWDIATCERPLKNPAWLGVGPGEISHYTGFRCARSAAP
jgi:formylglycine-generating enzyme required for sulfatase activity